MSLAGIAANSLFSSLSQALPSQNRGIPQEFQELGQDLKSGNLAAAQQAYSTIQQDLQTQSSSPELARAGHHHRHISGDKNTTSNAITQLMSELGTALQTGNLPNAQQAYASLQQDLAGFTQADTSGTPSAANASAGVSLNA